MSYFKTIADGFVIMVGTGNGGTEITEAEYSEILSIIRNKPQAPDGYDYRLKTDLTWETVKLPDPEPADDELTAEEALDIIMGGGEL